MQKIRIGIIGTGMISQRHMTIWSKIPEAEVVAGCDIDENRLAQWGEQHGIKSLYRDYKDLLARDDIDAVDVCVHNNLHVPLSLSVMRSGKHCYCEKPMAGSYADAKLLYESSKEANVKLAIQISSIFTLQTLTAKNMVDSGELGNVYHMRSVGNRRLGRPGLDFDMGFSPNFYSAEYAGRGALFDMGVYHISQLLFVAGIPQLESVYGSTYQEIETSEAALKGRKFEVEELGIGLAKYKGGLTLDIIESWAINMDVIGNTFIAGSKGGLSFKNIDSSGGPLAVPTGGTYTSPELYYHGIQDGRMFKTDLQIPDNMMFDPAFHPEHGIYCDNHLHWLAYLRGDLTDETRYDTPYLALQTMLVSEGICLSKELGRSVTAEEIDSMSKSTAIRRQETDWGVLEYEL